MAKNYHSLILFIFIIPRVLLAASCCGGGQSASSVMTADHLEEWSYSTLYRADIGQTDNDGYSLMDSEQNDDRSLTYAIEYKKLIAPKWQLNTNLNYISKESQRLGKNEKSSGLGDLSLGGFYEALSNDTYHEWAPRIFMGIKFTIPFGKNNFSSQKVLRTDIRGAGFYKLDFPAVFLRNNWKVSLTPQFYPSQNRLNATYALSTATSYTQALWENVDLTMTIQWNYLNQKKISIAVDEKITILGLLPEPIVSYPRKS